MARAFRFFPVHVVALLVFTSFACGCGGGPATQILNKYEQVVEAYEKQVAKGGKFGISEFRDVNEEMSQMRQDFRAVNKKQVTAGEQRRFVSLGQRFNRVREAMEKDLPGGRK